MRRKALPLLLAATLALGGYAAFQQVASKESGARKTDSIEGPAHMEGEKSMYKEITENVIYLAGGCFWGHGATDAVHPRCHRRPERLR